jgi:hypothetical protein
MGALYVYAIVERPELALPPVAGLGGAAIAGLAAGDLMAIVSPLDGGAPPLSRESLLGHERVIEALMGARAALPTRFGTTAESAERLVEALQTDGARYRANLDRVRGRVEIAVRVGWEPETGVPAARPRADAARSGRAYMLALLEQTRRDARRREDAEALVADLTAGLSELADTAVETVLPAPQLLLKAAYLVRRERLAELRHRIEAMRAANPSLAILATGPWPAYSFVEA